MYSPPHPKKRSANAQGIQVPSTNADYKKIKKLTFALKRCCIQCVLCFMFQQELKYLK